MNNLDNIVIELCLRQIFIPPKSIRLYGWGDCQTCEPDKNNVYCTGYYPIQISTYEVK